MNTTHTLVLVLAIVSHAMAQSAAPPNLRFQRFDKNGDGKLSQEEFAYPYFFKRYDEDGDGMLSQSGAAEIKAVGRQAPTSSGTTDTAASIPAAASDFKPRPHGEEAVKAGLKPEVLAKLDIALQQAVANKEVSGVIGLIHHNGVRGYFQALGWQDIEAQKPMAKDAIFRLQSMSKPVVTAGALTLLDEGTFDLDEPISKHLPEWQEPTVQEHGRPVPARNPITPRMLMSHSSGLYYGTIEGGPFTGGATDRGARTTLAEHSKSLAAKPLKFHPGEGYSYGTSIDVLGRYTEAVSGMPLDEFLKERLFTPLKMVDTDFWVAPEKTSRPAQLYSQPEPGELRRGRDIPRLAPF